MTRGNFFMSILALLFGWKLKPKNVICHVRGCDLYGHRHPGWHSQYLREAPNFMEQSRRAERYREKILYHGVRYSWPKPSNIIIPKIGG